MSKAEPVSGSLEDILSSIRKSLAEQSTDDLGEAPDPAQPLETKSPASRREGLVGRLANATAGLPDRAGARDDDLSDVLEPGGGQPRAEPPAAASPAPEGHEKPAAAQLAASASDPLWFLTRKEPEPASGAGAPVRGAADSAPLTQPEVLRAALPPFFGASTQGPQVETVSTASRSAGVASHAGREFGRVLDPAIAREVSLVAAAAETAGRPVAPGAPPAPPGAKGGEVPHALEAMVLELLKPMLRQWLDQNMPRLVAAALKEEADRAAGGNGSAAKP